MCYKVGESARPVMISTYQVGCLQMSVMLQRHLLSGTYAQDLDTSQLAFLDWHQAQTTTVTSWAGGEYLEEAGAIQDRTARPVIKSPIQAHDGDEQTLRSKKGANHHW